MKNLLIFLFLILTTNVFAQIKEQYVAANDKKTTIVVKEGRASDKDILAQNFNLDDYRVGDVIRITTTKEEPVKKEAKSSGSSSSSSSSSRTRVKRKKKRSFSLFKKSYKGKKRRKKSSYLKCYSF